MKHKIIKIIFGTISIAIFSGCAANYENINPRSEVVANYTKDSEALKALYIKEGYAKGEVDGFSKGLEFGKKVVDGLLNELKAKQFAIYLYKERFIEAGPIYIDPNSGEIELGCMEMRRPFTVADIFTQYGAEIPIKSEELLQKELLNIDNEIKKIQSSVSADIFTKKTSSKEITNENVNGYLVKMYNTKSNEDMLKRFNYNYGVIDDKLIIKFNDKETANNLCNNFGCISPQ